MKSRRSYLDHINTGRQRRSGASLDQISRTLDDIEDRLANVPRQAGRGGQAERDIVHRMRRLSDKVAGHGGEGAEKHRQAGHPDAPTRSARETGSRGSLERLARDAERTRRQEDEFASVGRIAGELKTLREEIARALPTRAGASDTDLGARLEHLSGAVDTLAERSGDRDMKMLGEEMGTIKESLNTLAREDTPRSVDERRDDIENRVTSDMRRENDPAIQALNARLDQISGAVDNLPGSLSLRTLEERVQTLAGALHRLTEQHGSHGPDMYAMIEERMDEISRAIAASTAPAQAPTFDAEPFERIEARIASLARQVEELVEDRPNDDVGERLNALSQRIDEIARRVDIPRDAVERLAGQIANISDRLDTVSRAPDTDAIFRGLEDRFAHLSDLIERRQGDAIEQGQALFRDLERRLDEVAERIDRRSAEAAGPDPDVMAAIDARLADMATALKDSAGGTEAAEGLRALEARLDDISSRLQSSAGDVAGLDPEIVRNLEAQVQSLSEHLSRPDQVLPEFEDMGPRLDRIERSIADNREAVVEAARRAAGEAISALGESRPEPAAVAGLAEELKALDALTRRSDERNNKTFEAIHDTLLKIVDRLGDLDTGPRHETESADPDTGGKIAVEAAPSIAPAEAEASFAPPADEAQGEEDTGQDEEERARRTPAEAAAAAAEAALQGDGEGEGASRAKRSMLDGLTRAFSARRNGEEAKDERVEPALDAADARTEGDSPFDPASMNEPIEPGSGAPDLNAIMRRVRDENEQPASRAESETGKADFIAAARRAAQAAAADADMQKKRQSAAGDGSSRLGLGKLLKRRRKSVLATLVAAIVIIGALQVGPALLSDNDAEVARVDEPGAEESAPPAVAGQDDADAAAEKAETIPTMGDAAPVRVAENGDEQVADDADDATTPRMAATEFSAPEAEAAEEGSGAAVRADSGSEEIEITPAALPDTAAETAGPDAARDQTALADIPAEAGPVALREAAADGDPRALFAIGSRYADGQGVESDMAEAVKWYESAAERGLAPAQYRVGNFYEKGIGVERDVDTAKTWYQMAAEQGNASAMHNLGVLFAMGTGGATDNESAARWFQRAAELGVKDSQFNLGILSAKGVGVPQDLVEAYKWLALVAEAGDNDAAEKRDEVANALDAEALERARATTELWKPKAVEPESNVVDIPDEWTEGDTTTASVEMEQAVANIQRILDKNGYDAGPADGIMGDKTKDAITAFQKDNDMEPTGEVNEALVRALLESK